MSSETERKFLIRMPESDRLKAADALRVRLMVQTYLTSEGDGERRIRKITENGTDSYV